MIGNTKQTVPNVWFSKLILFYNNLWFPTQVDSTCAQFHTVACNGVQIGNPTKTSLAGKMQKYGLSNKFKSFTLISKFLMQDLFFYILSPLFLVLL